MSYNTSSRALYNQLGFEANSGEIRTLAQPEIIFNNTVINPFGGVDGEFESWNALFDFLESKPYSSKIGIFITLMKLIDADADDNAYWRAVNQLQNIPAAQRGRLLMLISSFCKNHNIPFFDVYQNSSQNNIVGRIYSLMPFTADELKALVFIKDVENIGGEVDSDYLLEIILNEYNSLFNQLTLTFISENEPISVMNIEYDHVPEQVDTARKLVRHYLGEIWGTLNAIVLTEAQKKEFEEKKNKGRDRKIDVNFFTLYYDNNRMFLEVKDSSLWDGVIEKGGVLNSSVNGANNKEVISRWLCLEHGDKIDLTKDFKIISGGTVTIKKLITPEQYYLCEKKQNGVVVAHQTNKVIYQKDVVGYVCISSDSKVSFTPQTDWTQIPDDIRGGYLNVRDETSIELTGGLKTKNGEYMWFALPDALVHNNSVGNIKIKLNGEDINNQGETIRDKFYTFLENRQRNENPALMKNENQEPAEFRLNFSCNGIDLGSSIRIEELNYSVPKSSETKDIKNLPIEAFELKQNISRVSEVGLDFGHRRESLLYWLSRFEEQGVGYERLISAILYLYFSHNERVAGDFNLAKAVKRLIEQFIGLNFIRAEDNKYIANKAHFITTHQGKLMLTGARSANQLRKFLKDPIRYNGLYVDGTVSKIYPNLEVPRLLKYNTNSEGEKARIYAILQGQLMYQTYGTTVDPRGNGTQINSYPLYILQEYFNDLETINENKKLVAEILEYKKYDYGILDFKAIAEDEVLKPNDILEKQGYGTTGRFIYHGVVPIDNIMQHELSKVKFQCNVNALYYEIKNNADLGWCYNEGSHELYIPRAVNVPLDIRIVLQCAVGSYTRYKFVKRKSKTNKRPLISQEEKLLEPQGGDLYIEMEIFYGITPTLLKTVTDKLNIKFTNVKGL